jgi:hypothetical protein
MQWLKPVILATWEAEIWRFAVKDSLGKKFRRPPCQPVMALWQYLSSQLPGKCKSVDPL